MRSNRWFILAVLFAVRAAMGFQFQIVGTIGPTLIDAFAIDYARLGTLIGLYLLPGVVIALPGGVLGNRFGVKRVALVGLALMAAGGVAAAFAPSFAALAATRLVSGTGAVLMNVAITALVSDWFVGRELRTAMAVVVTSWPFGLALGLLVFAPVAHAYGWPAAMLAGAAAALVMLLLLAVAYRDPADAPAHHGAALPLRLTAREWRLVLVAGGIWGTYNVGYIVLVSFLPDLFVARGATATAAAGMTSLLGWALIVMVPAGGVLADRSEHPDAVMLVGFAVGALAVMLMALPAVMLPAYALMLAAGGLPAGAVMALPAAAVRPESRAAGMGVFFTCYYALMAALPAFAGLARDLTGSETAPLFFAAAMLLAAVAALAAFRRCARACA